MKISKKDALIWFEFFSLLPEEGEISPKQEEIFYSTFAQTLGRETQITKQD